MKKVIAALSFAVASIASHASVITEFQTKSNFPTPQNNFSGFSFSGNSNGSGSNGVNLLYTVSANTSSIGFDFTASQFSTLFVQITAADSSITNFDRAISNSPMFWGFSAQDTYISTVKFFTTNAGGNNVANDKLTISNIIGFVQPTSSTEVPTPPITVPEPGTVALLGLGLLSVSVLRRKTAKEEN